MPHILLGEEKIPLSLTLHNSVQFSDSVSHLVPLVFVLIQGRPIRRHQIKETRKCHVEWIVMHSMKFMGSEISFNRHDPSHSTGIICSRYWIHIKKETEGCSECIASSEIKSCLVCCSEYLSVLWNAAKVTEYCPTWL